MVSEKTGNEKINVPKVYIRFMVRVGRSKVRSLRCVRFVRFRIGKFTI